jgi:NADH-quinone oxidoreductase subunit K
MLSVTILIFHICIMGIILNFRNFLVILMGIEVILLSLNLNFICFSMYLDDLYGQIVSLFILTVAASESAVGLAILIIYFRIHHNILINQDSTFKV